MENIDIKKLQSQVHKELERYHILEALKRLATLTQECGRWDFTSRHESLATSYSYMLHYLRDGMPDPERATVLNQLICDAHTLADECAIALLENSSADIFYFRHKAAGQVQMAELLNQYRVERNKLAMLQAMPAEQRNSGAIADMTGRCERLESDIFNHTWSMFPTGSQASQAISDALADESMPAHMRSLLLSALMLGALVVFDPAKTLLLLNAYRTLGEPELQLRAVIGAMIVVYLYRDRLPSYSAITATLAQLSAVPTFATDVRMIFTRLAHSRNTENISRRFSEGIIPEIKKMDKSLFDKLKGKQPLENDIASIEENPEWQQWLEDSGLEKKLREFNELQLEGGDVFISTFAKLKHYPFFNTLSNWFLPFHEENSIVAKTLGNASHSLSLMLRKMPIICDSDKYSMLLSIGLAPAAQREMLMQQMEGQREQIEELERDQSDPLANSRDNIANRYIQDLYRFFKLYSRRREFTSIFESDIDLIAMTGLLPALNDAATLTLIAEFYMKNGFYPDAIKYYTHLLRGGKADALAYQKLGFCHYSQGDWRRALESYAKYEIADGDNLWNLRQMAQCHRNLHDYDKAIAYYEKALALDPENVNLCLNMGHCFLAKNDYDKALKQYYRADFMPGAKHRAWRPLAWCLFMTGDYDQALKYYEKIIGEDTPTAQDYLNYGHVLQAMGDVKEAIERYRQSLSAEENAEQFAAHYREDAKYMVIRKGIAPASYELVLDAVMAV